MKKSIYGIDVDSGDLKISIGMAMGMDERTTSDMAEERLRDWLYDKGLDGGNYWFVFSESIPDQCLTIFHFGWRKKPE